METITVHERLHHGDYLFERTETISATREAVLAFLSSSPYRYGYASDERRPNPYIEKTITGILAGERTGLGWSWFTRVAEPVAETPCTACKGSGKAEAGVDGETKRLRRRGHARTVAAAKAAAMPGAGGPTTR